MGFLKRLFGGQDEREREELGQALQRVTPHDGRTPSDQQAIERYRYLVRTAPPQAIEQAHEQAFAQLTPEQRRVALQQLSKTVPAHERSDQDDPNSLARMATRAELQQPGVVERMFSGRSPMSGGGYGYADGLFGGAFMSSLAGAFVGSILAQGLYDSFFDIPENNGGDPSGSVGDYAGAESATAENEYGAQEAGPDLGDDLGGEFGGTEL